MNAAKLKGAMAEAGKTQKEMAEILGMAPKTFAAKLASGSFGVDDAKTMTEVLNIQNPVEIFLTNE